MLFALIGYWLIMWWIFTCLVEFIVFKIPLPEKRYLYIKKEGKLLGWTWSWWKLCIVRLKYNEIKEFKIFWDK